MAWDKQVSPLLHIFVLRKARRFQFSLCWFAPPEQHGAVFKSPAFDYICQHFVVS